MIYDKIENLALYNGLNINVEKVVSFLQKTNLNTLDEGVHYIDDKNLFLIVQNIQTSGIEGKMFEGHKKYIDIQYIYTGEELMKYASKVGNEEVLKTFPVENDIAMYEPKTQHQDVTVKAGYFVIFNTDDLHMPCIETSNGPSSVKKFVFKLKK